MEKKEYLVGVTIIEGRSIKGKDSGGTSDPFVKITVANLPPQVTLRKYQTNTGIWNQSFTFPGVMMNQYELETFELLIECYDYNSVLTDELIGYQSIGLSTLYRNLNHEFYRAWFSLFNPEEPNECQGYLQCSCFIIGPNERPPAHAGDEARIDDEEEMDEDGNAGMSEEKKIELMKKKQGLFLIQQPIMAQKGYQLSVNILKAEGLPQCDSGGGCNSFISVRAVGAVQTTRVVQANYMPLYQARICFPVYVPLYNDKITVRVWHQNRRVADTFIANIPEFPSAFDNFNITKLLSQDGKMRAHWFNLYGVHPLDRGWFQKNTKGNKKEGSTYLGRVLVSMSLAPNEKPQLMVTMSNPAKEPNSANYQLWVDVYDLVNCDEAKGNQVWIVATIGSYKSAKHWAKYKDKVGIYQWQKISIKPVTVNFPVDMKQTPDIIINVYCEKTFAGQDGHRLGYVRIPVKECFRKNAYPQWYRLRSPTNEKSCPGIILMNVQYVFEDAERFPKQRGVEGTYKIWSQVLSGFEIAPSILAENLNTLVDIKIGNIAAQKDQLKTKEAPGRYPQWGKEGTMVREVVLDKNLSFAPDMIVLVFNKKKGITLFGDQEYIGSFTVPVTSMTKLYKKPQFFNIIDNEGRLQGQILARFYLKEFDQKKKNDDLDKITDMFNMIFGAGPTVNINISLIGLRNLVKNARRPKITFKLTNQSDEEAKTVQLEESFDTKNPTLGQIITFEKIKLLREPLLWPQLSVNIYDDGIIFGIGGCETCFTTIPVFEYANELLTPKEIEFAKVQLNKNQNKISLVQKQINPIKYYNKAISKTDKDAGDDDDDDSDDEDDDDEDSDDEFGINMVGGLKIKELGQGEKQNKKKDESDGSEDELVIDNIVLNVGGGVMDDSADDVYKTAKDKKKGPGPVTAQDGVVIDTNNIIEVVCNGNQKQQEEDLRKKKIEKIEQKIDSILLQIETLKPGEKREKLKLELLEMKNKITALEDEQMSENKFWGYVMDDAADEFNYGRDVIREGTMESRLVLPYTQFPLFTTASWGSKTAQVSGILRSGFLTGALIKAKITINSSADLDGSDDEDSVEEEGEKNKPKDQKDQPKLQEDKDEEDKEQQLLIQERFLKLLLNYKPSYKVRVYLLTCQNLSATESYVDFKARLAGYQALCSADPYPVVAVGDGVNDTLKQKVKSINERDKNINQNLNPKFFRSYEFDATFPEDWKLELQIYDKGSFAFFDQLIGSTVIDLEDRMVGNFRQRTIEAINVYKEVLVSQQNKENKNDFPDQKKLQKIKQQLDEIYKWTAKLNQIDPKPIPVEFRELRHPNNRSAQGMVEMWVEVLTQQDARKIPMSRLQQQANDEYEIRLIIWETRDVPLVNGKSVDIFIKVTYDPEGWTGGDLTKQTDVHYASKDGRGVFNYRFKFDLKTPVNFPRLKFAIYDYGFVSDEAIGESILNLKKTISLLQKEGRIDVPKTYLSFVNTNEEGKECGQLLISMTIIPKAEADAKPVGEAWDEPNVDPHLEKPTEGRGLGDALMAATGINFAGLSLPKFNFFRNFIIIGIVFGVVIVVLIMSNRNKNATEPQEGRVDTKGSGKEKTKAKEAKTIEEQIAELESEDSEIEELKKRRNKKRLFNDKQWKIIVAIMGSGIAISLIILTLNMIEQLLSGGSSN